MSQYEIKEVYKLDIVAFSEFLRQEIKTLVKETNSSDRDWVFNAYTRIMVEAVKEVRE